MLAIETKYLAATGRIKASTDQHALYYPVRGNSDTAHGEAACALARKLGWNADTLIGGWTSRGYAWVLPEGDTFHVDTGARNDGDATATNPEGLTYNEWLRAAGAVAESSLYRAWLDGEDPTEYRA